MENNTHLDFMSN